MSKEASGIKWSAAAGFDLRVGRRPDSVERLSSKDWAQPKIRDGHTRMLCVRSYLNGSEVVVESGPDLLNHLEVGHWYAVYIGWRDDSENHAQPPAVVAR